MSDEVAPNDRVRIELRHDSPFFNEATAPDWLWQEYDSSVFGAVRRRRLCLHQRRAHQRHDVDGDSTVVRHQRSEPRGLRHHEAGTVSAMSTPEMELMTELCGEHEYPSAAAMDLLVAIDFSGWVLTKKSALHRLCRQAGVDYDEFDPTDGGRAEWRGGRADGSHH